MKGEDLGIVLSQPELALLLAHADKESETLNCVAFAADINTVSAYASDGTCAVAGTGDNDGFRENSTGEQQWRVVLPFLERVKKSLKAKDYVRFQFSGASLTEAVILERFEEDGEPVIEELTTVTWHEDACNQQAQFPYAGARDACKPLANDKGVPQTISPRFLKRLGIMAALATNEIEMRSGKSASSGIMAIAKTSDGTDWVCRIMPRGEEAQTARKAERDQQELLE